MTMVVLKPERSDVIRTRRHPWIYSGAVLSASEEAIRGDLVPVAEAGGRLMSFTCSGAVLREDFLNVLREASRRAGRDVQLLQELHAASDHPVLLGHPEGEYLRGWLLRVL